MDHKHIDWDTLVKYINGESTREEEELLLEWMKSDAKNGEFVTFLKKIWDTSAEKKETWDVDAAWFRFGNEYDRSFSEKTEADPVKPERTATRSLFSQPKKKKKNYSWIAVAASVVIVFLALYSLVILPEKQQEIAAAEEQPVYREIITKNGQRTHLNLSDGSRVILNAGSKISLPESFDKKESREIRLSGEAYFEVAHNPEKPFIVRTDMAVTRVLGTKFQVRSYPEDKDVKVVVSEGKVALRRQQETGGEPGAIINKNQLGLLTDSGSAAVSNVDDLTPYLGWTEGKLIFNQEPLNKVVLRLRRWYDLDVQLDSADSALAQRELTATFTQAQPVREVIETIALTLDIDYKKEGDRFAFHFFNNK